MQTHRQLPIRLCALVFVLGFVVSFPFINALSQTSSDQATTNSMPPARFYSLIFKHVLALQTEDAAETSAKLPAGRVKGFYGRRVGMSSNEQATLESEAAAWKADVSPVDDKAYAVIAAIRASTPGGHLLQGEVPPAPDPQLQTLQNTKDALTLAHVDHLQKQLGATRFAQVDSQIRRLVRLTYSRPTTPRVGANGGSMVKGEQE